MTKDIEMKVYKEFDINKRILVAKRDFEYGEIMYYEKTEKMILIHFASRLVKEGEEIIFGDNTLSQYSPLN